MSRIGQKPVPVAAGVKVNIANGKVTISGSKATLEQVLPTAISAEHKGQEIIVRRDNDTSEVKALHGLARSLINNMVIGVTQGFKKELEIRGVGYRAEVAGPKLKLALGYSHPIEMPIPPGITVVVLENTKVTISGADKHGVGQLAASIRAVRPPDVYKGKGVRYVGEYVIVKQGKSV